MTPKMPRPPSPATLRKYGITRAEWVAMAAKFGGRCWICNQIPKNGRLVVDHEHVHGWRKLPAGARKLYVRGLLCVRCNWRFVPKGMTFGIATAIATYLRNYAFFL